MYRFNFFWHGQMCPVVFLFRFITSTSQCINIQTDPPNLVLRIRMRRYTKMLKTLLLLTPIMHAVNITPYSLPSSFSIPMVFFCHSFPSPCSEHKCNNIRSFLCMNKHSFVGNLGNHLANCMTSNLAWLGKPRASLCGILFNHHSLFVRPIYDRKLIVFYLIIAIGALTFNDNCLFCGHYIV